MQYGLCMYLMYAARGKETNYRKYDQEMPQSHISSCWLVPDVVFDRVYRGAT